MADITTYKRAIMAYAIPASNIVIHVGEIRQASDAIVTANPQWWVALDDTTVTTPGKSHTW